MRILSSTSSVSLILPLMLLVGCSGDGPSEVTFLFPKSSLQSARVSSITNIEGFAADVASSGLIKNRSCYFIHVTAPDLNVPGTGDSNDDSSCPAGVPDVPALGKFFGPFRYGQDATVSVPAGPGRRFDLLGFINPYPNDPTCSKSFEVKTFPDGNETRVVLRYGEYEIDPEGSTQPGLLAPTSPFGRLGFFFHSDVTTLAPGKQTVKMNSVAWTSEPAPQSYGCHDDDDGSSPYVRINAPFTEVYRPEFAEEDSCGGAVSGLTAPYQCIHTGLRAGPIRIECPSGATSVKIYQGSDAVTVGAYTAVDPSSDTVSCSAASKEFVLDSTHLIGGLTSTLDDHYVKMIPVNNSGVALATGTWTAVFRFSSRYNLVQYSSGGTTTSNFTSSDYLTKYVGYRKSGDVRELFYETDYMGGYVSSSKFGISPSGIWNSALSESASPTAVTTSSGLPNLITKTPPNMATQLSMGGSALSRLSLSPASLQFYNTTASSIPYGTNLLSSCSASMWCSYENGAHSAAAPTLATDAGKILVTDDNYEMTSTTRELTTTLFSSNSSIVGGMTSEPVQMGPYSFQNEETLSPLKTKLDAAGSNAVIATLFESDLTSQTTLRVRTCPQGLDSCTTPVLTTHSEPNYIDMDLLVTPLGNKFVVGILSGGTTSFTFKKTTPAGTSITTALSSDSTRFFPPIDDIGLTLDATAFEVQNVKLRALSNTDQGITGNDLMIKVELVNGGGTSYTLLYRSQDLGERWYLVRAESERDIVDMVPFHFYRKDSSGENPPYYEAGFMILRKYNMLEQDWAGF